MDRRFVPAWVRRLLSSPVDELSRLQRAARFGIELTRHCAGELRHDKAGQMGAALTYHTLFSILPTLVLVLIALNSFTSAERRDEFKTGAVDWTLEFLEIQPERLALDPGLVETRRAEFEAVRRQVDEQLTRLFEALEGVNLGSIGLLGVLLFIYGATGLLATVERSFNGILGIASGRPWYVRLPLYYTVITLAPILILMGQWLRGWFFGIIESGVWSQWLARPAAVAAPIVALWVLIFLLYVLLPTGRVGKRAALVGSLVAAILLLAAREVFRLYTTGVMVTSLYGALTLIPVFLLYLWLNWLLVLFGLELTYTLNTLPRGSFKRDLAKPHEDELIDPAWAVPLSVEIAEAFARGEARSPSSLSRSMNLHPLTVDRMLAALAAAGIVHRVTGKDRSRYTLARPAEDVTVSEVLAAARAAFRSAPGNQRDHPAWRFLNELDAEELEATSSRTLAELRRPPVP